MQRKKILRRHRSRRSRFSDEHLPQTSSKNTHDSINRSELTSDDITHLQRTMGNQYVMRMLDIPAKKKDPKQSVQRDYFDTYETMIGHEENSALGASGTRQRYRREMGKPDAVHDADYADERKTDQEISDNEDAIRAMLDTVFAGVIVDDHNGGFTKANVGDTEEDLVDRIFTNIKNYANANFEYSAGASGGGAQLVLGGSGHCGMLARNFMQVVNTAAGALGLPFRASMGAGINYHYVTPTFPTLPGNPQFLAGSNQSNGNVYQEFSQNGITRGYGNIKKAKFNYHQWAQVTFTSGTVTQFDLLLGFSTGNYPDMTPNRTGAGQPFLSYRDPDAPPAAGFGSGQIIVHNDAKYTTYEIVADELQAAIDRNPKLEKWATELSTGNFERKSKEARKRDRSIIACKQAYHDVCQVGGVFTDDYFTKLLELQNKDNLLDLWRKLYVVNSQY